MPCVLELLLQGGLHGNKLQFAARASGRFGIVAFVAPCRFGSLRLLLADVSLKENHARTPPRANAQRSMALQNRLVPLGPMVRWLAWPNWD